MVTTGPATAEDLLRDAREALLADGWQALHPYRKWQGAHWRLLSYVELGGRGAPRVGPMVDRVLDWLTGEPHRRSVVTLEGRVRRCASQEGNALLVAVSLGYEGDARTRRLADELLAWQWPDGGWNCDTRPAATASSFHETLAPLRGLAALGRAVGDADATAAARRAAALLLSRRLFRSRRTGTVIHPEWLRIHWPAYWHYDVLQGLRGLAEAGLVGRPEAAEALAWLAGRQRPDGSWRPSGRRYWRPAGSGRGGVDVVDWTGLDAAVVTAQAEAVLAAAG